MPDVLQLGPFMIQTEWLLLAISGFVGYQVIKQALKAQGYERVFIMEKLSNGLLIVFAVWKVSPVIFNPSMILDNPLGVLIMPGSSLGTLLGIVIACGYLVREMPKIGVSYALFADLLVLGFVSAACIYSLLGWQYGSDTSLPWGISIKDPAYKYHPLNVYHLILSSATLLWFYKKRNVLGSGRVTLTFLTYYTAGLMLISLYKPMIYSFYGITFEQMIFLTLMTAGFALSLRRPLQPR